MPESAMPRPASGSEGEQSSASDDGLIRLRRQSDWTRQARPDDDAAEAAYRAALDVATATLAAYDGGTASHSDDVITLSLALSEELGVTGRDRAYLLAAAELHDIGKVGVSADILRKPEPLDDAEWQVVRQHTVTGQRILGAVPELAGVARIVRHCHERWDGDGYPDGLKGEQIPLAARIVFCADAFHAIRGDRPYRRGRSAKAALAEVKKHAGTQFDPAVVDALIRVRTQVRGGRSLSASLVMGGRSRRLAALLITMVVAGGALAATGIWNPPGGKASPATEEPRTPATTAAGDAAEAAARPAQTPTNGDLAARRAAKEAALQPPKRAPDARKGDAAAERKSRSTGRSGATREAAGGRAAPVFRRRSGASPPSRTPASRAPAGRTPPRRAPADRAPPRRPPKRAPRRPAAGPPVTAPAPAPTTPAPVPQRDDDDDDDDGSGDDGSGGGGHGNGHDKGRGRGHDRHPDDG